MKYLFVFFFALSPFLASSAEYGSSMQSSFPKKIIINNRPLIKINGKVISMMDVVKHLDLYAYENFPKVMESLPEKFQFYMQNWVHTFQDMIQNELMLADAEAKEVKISDGDIREEMLSRFGPRLMPRLDQLNLTYEEARELVRQDLIVRKMRNFKIYSKAFQLVTPAVIKEKYDEYLVSNPPQQQWEYKVISFRGKKEEILLQAATKVSKFLSVDQLDIDSALTALKEESGDLVSANTSEVMKADEKSISKEHQSILISLKDGCYSEPIKQYSRYDKSSVYRIFYLLSHSKKNPIAFEKMSEELKNKLIGEVIDNETNAYMSHLRKRFGITEESLQSAIPKNFQPFSVGTE